MFRKLVTVGLLCGLVGFASVLRPPSYPATTYADSRTQAVTAASAEVIFDNIGANGGLSLTGASPASQRDGTFPFEAGSADDFILPPSPLCTWSVTGVRWTGHYWVAGERGLMSGFRIIFWADDEGVPMGGGEATADVAKALAVYEIPGTANETPSGAGAPDRYDYSADLSEPFMARPGVRYWIQIQADMLYPPQWGLQVTNARGGAGPVEYFDLLRLPTWTAITDPGDLAFQLTGEARDVVCDDLDACTEDTCVDGVCVSTPITCDDADACTIDSCDPAAGCVASPVTCDDGSACTEDTCDPASGCVFTSVECDDGNACTEDSCDPAGGCTHTPVTCDDGSACTEDLCDPTEGCVYTPVSCDDGDACTEDSCDDTRGCLTAPVTCDDSSACTNDSCDSAIGCVFSPISCDDGDACTEDACDPASGCVTTPISCDDGSACTDDSCDPNTGCAHTPITCDDGDACTADTCDPVSGCVTAPVTCDDGNACTDDACDPAEGCVTTEVTCDDADACTDDTCDPATGCVFKPVDCDDANPCTVDSCTDGVCEHTEQADLDGDGDIDLDDFAFVQECIVGATFEVLVPDCACVDFNGDGQIDMRDYSAFQFEFTGSR